MPRSDDDTPDPREENLARRSRTPALGIWLIIAAILMLGVAVYVFSAL